jgi:hypothetical protein
MRLHRSCEAAPSGQSATMSRPLPRGNGFDERSSNDGAEDPWPNDALRHRDMPRPSTHSASSSPRPPSPEGEWWSLFADAQQPRSGRRQILAAVGNLSVLAVALVAISWLVIHTIDSSGSQSNSGTTSPGATVITDADDRLRRMLPRGYTTNGCAPAVAPDGALAEVVCGRGPDAGGPPSATFVLVRDSSTLAATFEATVQRLHIVNCPGNIQSPGPWHTNAEPAHSQGTVACGLRDGVPTVAWTNDDELLVNVVHAGQRDSPVNGLYRWWSAQS